MATLHAGRLLARRYRLIDQIGAGGMSVIWRARDEVLDRTVALKVLAPSLAADARFRDMVREEARSAAQLVHPHVTAVHDYGEALAPDGSITSFVVMELLAGEELEYRLTEGPLPWPDAVEIGAQVAEALAAAHRLGIVHRDITPANVMMTPVGAKVLDFGIATHIGAPDEDEDGGTFGTPRTSPRSGWTGRRRSPPPTSTPRGAAVRDADRAGAVPGGHLGAARRGAGDRRRPAPLEVPALPTEVARICLRCLSREPQDRPSAHRVALALRDQLLPADPQAATMLAPTMTLPSIVGPPEPPPAPVAGPPAAAGPAASTPDVAPPGEGGRRRARSDRRRWPVPVIAVGVVVVTGLALLLPTVTREADPPPPGAAPTGAPTVAASTPAPDPSPSAPSAPAPTRPPGRTPRTPSAATTPPTPSGGSLAEAASRIDQLIEAGVADGGIRTDVGTDLRNLLGHATAAGGRDDLAGAVRRARDKVADRRREGSITPAYARQLDTAFQQLGVTRV